MLEEASFLEERNFDLWLRRRVEKVGYTGGRLSQVFETI